MISGSEICKIKPVDMFPASLITPVFTRVQKLFKIPESERVPELLKVPEEVEILCHE
jgi:hypothetical protein